MDAPDLKDTIYNYDTLADWLEANCPPDLVIAPNLGVTVAMLIARVSDMADDAWSDGIDAMGEDA